MLRKFCCSLVCVAVLFQAIAGAPQARASAADGIVRVRLSVEASASIPIFIDGNYSVSGNDAVALERQLYTVKLEGSQINLYYGGKQLCGGASLRLVQHTATPGRNNFIALKWTIGSTSAYAGYLGDMEFTVSGGSIAVTNYVSIEDYLYGVVPHEMSNSWPVEALKAQAVAARNYVRANMDGSGGYDVVDTSLDQVYRGFSKLDTNAIQAVDSTAGQVVTCGGKLAEVFFGASNGGWTEIPQHVWNASAPLQPYQVIQKDTYDTDNDFSRTEVLTLPKTVTDTGKIKSDAAFSQGSQNAEKYLKDLALPVIAALKTYTAGSTADFQITGFNTVTPNTYLSQHDILDYNKLDPCIAYQKADVNMNVLVKRASDGEQETVAVTVAMDMTQLAAAGGPYQAFDYTMGTLRLITASQDADGNWLLTHCRYGHGIGLSQRGAQQRALAEDPAVNTFDKILGFYYPNTELSSLGYTRPVLTPIAPPDHTNATAVCPGTTLNVRSTPDSSGTANILFGLPDGARLSVTQPDNGSGWRQIVFGNKLAYVSSAYVQADPGDFVPAPNPFKLGDVNADGEISISDYTLVRLSILGLKTLDGDAKTAADVNADGQISISDYTLIRMDILGIKKIS